MLELIWGSHRNLTMDQLCEAVAKRRSMERWFCDARGHSLLTEINITASRRARGGYWRRPICLLKNVCWLVCFRNIEQMRLNFLQTVGMGSGVLP